MSVILSEELLGAITGEMADLADRLCQMACVLANDPAVLNRHFDELQSIDLLTQIQRALIQVLEARGDEAERVAQVPVEALAARLAKGVASRRLAA